MKPPFRSVQEIVIQAPVAAVWAFNMDLGNIPEFHPRVVNVDSLTGNSSREQGGAYRCHLAAGKHSCVEKDLEIVPMQRIVTVLPEDTFPISKVRDDYAVETTLEPLDVRRESRSATFIPQKPSKQAASRQ
jgi:hypothetical protein